MPRPSAGRTPGLTTAQTAEAKVNGVQPTRTGGFGYMRGPDHALVEYAGNHPAERFNHVHMYQDDPFCAQLWYQQHLNAPVFAGRTSQTPLTDATCKVARGPDRTWPALDSILRDYLAAERAGASASSPLFMVMYKTKGGQRIWKLVKATGTRAGVPELHPHALRHASGAELYRRTRNLRVVQEQLRHADIQTTTGYTKLTRQDVRQALEMLNDEGEEKKDSNAGL